MAGRGGRGRGRGKGISFNVESLGFGRGESLPAPILQPPPIFPIAQFKPVPLENNDEQNYLLALKEELQATMRDSVYFIKPTEKKKEIERYSDKYQACNQTDKLWHPDYSRLPTELHPKRKRKATALRAKKTKAALDEINQQFDILAEQEEKVVDEGAAPEEEDEDDDPKKAKVEDQENEEEEVYDEDDLEEETDYNLTYFDNGENDDDDDDLDEGPVY